MTIPIGKNRPWGPAATVYEQVGGDEVVKRIADVFYDTIEEKSPVIHAMLPRNTRISRQKLYEFLSGWMGGPNLYWERRGHPALRMRHAPFAIDRQAAEEWAECMSIALDKCEIEEPARSWLDGEMTRIAMMLQNRV